MLTIFNEMIQKTEKTASEKISRQDGDYEKDGLIYCGNCHTAKQVIIKIQDEIRKVWCACACEMERTQAEIEAIELEQAKMKIEANRLEAFDGSSLCLCKFDTDDGSNSKLMRTAKDYEENFEMLQKDNKGLLFFGACDTGKTFATACILNALIDKRFTAKLVTFSDIENRYKDCLYLLQKYDILAIDDFGSQRDTGYMNEIVFSVINSRYLLKKPIIVTSNLTSDELKTPKNIDDERVYNRLLDMCIFIECKGKQHRKAKHIRDYEKYKNLLHL